jgi:hypothetical protein
LRRKRKRNLWKYETEYHRGFGKSLATQNLPFQKSSFMKVGFQKEIMLFEKIVEND